MSEPQSDHRTADGKEALNKAEQRMAIEAFTRLKNEGCVAVRGYKKGDVLVAELPKEIDQLRGT